MAIIGKSKSKQERWKRKLPFCLLSLSVGRITKNEWDCGLKWRPCFSRSKQPRPSDASFLLGSVRCCSLPRAAYQFSQILQPRHLFCRDLWERRESLSNWVSSSSKINSFIYLENIFKEERKKSHNSAILTNKENISLVLLCCVPEATAVNK